MKKKHSPPQKWVFPLQMNKLRKNSPTSWPLGNSRHRKVNKQEKPSQRPGFGVPLHLIRKKYQWKHHFSFMLSKKILRSKKSNVKPHGPEPKAVVQYMKTLWCS